MTTATTVAHLLPARISSDRVLEVLSRLGVATPRQICIAISGQPSRELSLSDLEAMRRRLHGMRRADLLTIRHIPAPEYPALHDPPLTRLRRSRLALRERQTHSREILELLALVAQGKEPRAGHWTDSRTVLKDLVALGLDQRQAIARIDESCRLGVLEKAVAPHPGIIWCVALTDRARRYLDRSPRVLTPGHIAVRGPRLGSELHALLTVEAALRTVIRDHGHLASVIIRGDEEVRSHSAKRHGGKRGRYRAMLPDAEVAFTRQGHDEPATQTIEVITPKYADSAIIAKVEGLPADTQFVATTDSQCDRFAELTGRSAALMSAVY